MHTEPYQVLFHKLKKTGVRLSEWSRSLFSKSKLHLHAALRIILELDVAQESRTLSHAEHDLRARLKKRVVSLAVLERSRKKQCARIANLREGDANTKYFHRRINARRRKNHILRLKHNNGWVTEHERKEEIILEHFSSVIGKTNARKKDFNWDHFHFEDCDLGDLDDPFTLEEVHNVIKQMPNDKAPGPDGFTGLFFKSCWGIIKEDVMRVIHQFGNLHVANLHWLNSANIVLFQRKMGRRELVTTDLLA